MVDALADFAYSTVAVAPSPVSTGTSVVSQTGDGANFPTPPFDLVFWPIGTKATKANAEITRCTNVVGDTFTIVRHQHGSTAQNITTSFQMGNNVTKNLLTEIINLAIAGAFPTFKNAGSPEGIQTATAVGQSYVNTTNGELWVYNGTPPSNTGWVLQGSTNAPFPTFTGSGSPKERGAWVLAATTPPTLPLVVTVGVNDTFHYVPIATSISELFTIAPGTYNTFGDVQGAMGSAVGTHSDLFSTCLGVDRYFQSLYLWSSVVGPSHNGDTLTPGPTDALADLGLTGGTVTLAGGKVGQSATLGQTYQDTDTSGIYIQTNTGPDAIGWAGANGIFDNNSFTTGLLSYSGDNGDFSASLPFLEWGPIGVWSMSWQSDGSINVNGTNLYFVSGVPTIGPWDQIPFSNSVAINATTGLWYFWDGTDWELANTNPRAVNVVTRSAPYAMSGVEGVVINNSSVTLPDPASFGSVSFVIKDDGGGTATIIPHAGEQIDGSSSTITLSAYGSRTVISYGGNWFIIAKV
jgi:hypothetical protein